tara:strand:- start:375 stop:1361 length:987 start_codon:yes stop_codon:yes gene_type:complete
MKSTGTIKSAAFDFDEEGLYGLRLPKPFTTVLLDNNNTTATGSSRTFIADRNTYFAGPIVTSFGREYQLETGMVDINSNGVVTGLETTKYAFRDAVIFDEDRRFSVGRLTDKTQILSVDSQTQITVSSASSSGGADGNRVAICYPGTYTRNANDLSQLGGPAAIYPPDSGKLYIQSTLNPLLGNTINYSSWRNDDYDNVGSNGWSFYITGTDEASMPSAAKISTRLIAMPQTGDGTGQSVRILSILFSPRGGTGAVADFYIKSWETGSTVLKASTPNQSTNVYGNLVKIDIPSGGIFCDGGAVFEFRSPADDSFILPSIDSFFVTYQM